MGGVFRNAAAFGAHGVLVDPTSCDPLYRKAIRFSVGGVLKVPFARWGGGEDVVGALSEAGFEVLALTPQGGEPLAGLRPPAKAAVLLGSEGPGLPAVVLQRARRISIPMAAGFDSLNLATTSGIVLHHLSQPR
jgi:tRNA G18 (ribose-2'-O)-methylase SpoU